MTNPPPHIFARYSSPNTTRYETILSHLLHGHAASYASGLAAFNGLLTFSRPYVIAIGNGYHGSHEVIKIHQKLYGLRKVDLFDEASWGAADLSKGDIVHLETPVNPSGTALNIAEFAEKSHRRGTLLSIDASFGPPGLQDPFRHGTDVTMHSGSKYLGGHSDILAGVLSVQNKYWRDGLVGERSYIGSVMGNFKGWLGVRSLRTLELRVQRASANAEALVKWFDGEVSSKNNTTIGKIVSVVEHASLQKEDLANGWLQKQMPNGYGPVFALWMHQKEDVGKLPDHLNLFHHAQSMGGVESLIEWRWMSDRSVVPRLLRVSVGIENVEDLKMDFKHALEALAEVRT